MVVLVGSCDSVSGGVGGIVVFPLDSVWVSWGEFVGAWGIDALWDLIVNESLIDAFMSVSGE